MSRFPRFEPERINDYSLKQRRSKVRAEDFARIPRSDSLNDWLDSLPSILAASDLRQLVAAVRQARNNDRARIWGFGGHVIKVGLGPLLIELMKRNFISGLATNGSGLIHDFEIAFCGQTSEDVEQELEGGRFGMARETGQYLNQFISDGATRDEGLGEAAGRQMSTMDLPYASHSVFLAAHEMKIPLTVHVAFGTDIIHNHPLASGQAIGRTSQIDFQIFCSQVSELNEGGVYLNLGSAVLLPEVFLKAVSLVRNSGDPLANFTTANLDFIQHYRPTQNVVRRPISGKNGRGIALTGHHEILIPLLSAALIWAEDSGEKQ